MRSALFALFLLLPLTAAAQSVDLIYTGDTYTPPFYRGGALWTGESRLRVLAVPQGLGDPQALNYRWSRGTTVLGSQSGVGRGFLTYTDTIFSKPQIFGVEIVGNNEEVLAQSFITVAPKTPSLLIYERNSLYGFLFNQEASAGYRLKEAETTFGAFPLFFSASGPNDSTISYSWRSRGQEDSTASTVTYRIPDEGAGQAAISLKSKNTGALRQAAEGGFLIQFGNEE